MSDSEIINKLAAEHAEDEGFDITSPAGLHCVTDFSVGMMKGIELERERAEIILKALEACECNIGLILDGGAQYRWRNKVEQALAQYRGSNG